MKYIKLALQGFIIGIGKIIPGVSGAMFAMMFGYLDAGQIESVRTAVFENADVPEIVTPYMKFYELLAMGEMGMYEQVHTYIKSYWGGMVKLGATSIWEQYIPEHEGIEHYGMYGMKYGCSLCHAWGGGPIYLLGRYCLGVYPTSVGYTTFAVEPNRGIYKYIDGKVPLPEGGEVSVKMDANACTVETNRDGGTLILKGKSYAIPKGMPLSIAF